ncbi:MAG: hypothetical protein KF788_17660 [Piscinibacter sp.]|nr:hypothetical protein [Piscinibacter sp.]
MTLLKSLGLKPTPEMRRRAALAAEVPTAAKTVGVAGLAKPGASDPGRLVKAKGEPDAQAAAFEGAGGDDEARRAAVALRPQLLAQQQRALEVRAQIQALARSVAQQLPKAQGAARAALEQKGKQIEKARAEVAQRLGQIGGDLEAIADPTTRREDLVKLLARAKAAGRVDALTEVETARGATDQAFNERKQVTTTSSFKDGTAEVDKRSDSLRVGLDGVTSSSTRELEQQDADGSSKETHEKTVKVGPGGVSVERKDAVAFEQDGKTFGIETGSSIEVGADGAKRTTTHKVSNPDGSSVGRTLDQAVTRGDGQLGVSEGTTTQRTGADGTTKGTTKTAKAGLQADGDTMGGFAGATAGATRKDKDGVNVGVVGGLHANVSCKIGEPTGQPAKYPVTLTVQLGAEIKLSGGRAKDGAAAGYGTELKLGGAVVMPVTRHLPAAELSAYVAALEGASKGGRVDATYAEMAIIQAGVQQGWEIAQRLYLKRDPLSPDMLAQLREAGDSNAVVKKTSAGAKLKGNVKAVDVEFGAQKDSEESKQATRDADGRLTIDSKQTDQEAYSAKVGVNMGLVGGSVGGSVTHREGFGYEISVDPAQDPGGRIAAALLACKTQPQFEAFITRYGKKKGAVEVRSRTTSKADARTSSVGLKVAGADLSLGTSSGTGEETRVDGDGQLLQRTVVGSAGAGGSVGVGDTRWGDASQSTATARVDGRGRASLDLARDQSQTTVDKVLDAAKAKADALKRTLGFGDDEKGQDKPAKGLLTSAAGGVAEDAPDTQRHDRYGLGLSERDLDAVARLASNDRDWTPRVGNAEDIKAWRAAGAKIRAAKGDRAVVAEELARFVGGASSDRMKQLRLFLRQGGQVKIGTAYNFPDELKPLKKDWDALVVGECDRQVLEAIDAQGAAKAATLGETLRGRLRQLLLAVRNSTQFGDPAAQADMVAAIVERSTALDAAVRKASGSSGAEADRAAAKEQFDQLCGACGITKRNFDELLATLDKRITGDSYLTQGEKNELFAPMEKLLELRGMLRRQIAQAKALGEPNGFPARRWEQFAADDKTVEKLKNTLGMHHSE